MYFLKFLFIITTENKNWNESNLNNFEIHQISFSNFDVSRAWQSHSMRLRLHYHYLMKTERKGKREENTKGLDGGTLTLEAP